MQLKRGKLVLAYQLYVSTIDNHLCTVFSLCYFKTTNEFLHAVRSSKESFPKCIQFWAKVSISIELVDTFRFEILLAISSPQGDKKKKENTENLKKTKQMAEMERQEQEHQEAKRNQQMAEAKRQEQIAVVKKRNPIEDDWSVEHVILWLEQSKFDGTTF